ncbi:MAG: hypothetical protein AB7F59_02980 [Bdellovibrionales bacterium]
MILLLEDSGWAQYTPQTYATAAHTRGRLITASAHDHQILLLEHSTAELSKFKQYAFFGIRDIENGLRRQVFGFRKVGANLVESELMTELTRASPHESSFDGYFFSEGGKKGEPVLMKSLGDPDFSGSYSIFFSNRKIARNETGDARRYESLDLLLAEGRDGRHHPIYLDPKSLTPINSDSNIEKQSFYSWLRRQKLSGPKATKGKCAILHY